MKITPLYKYLFRLIGYSELFIDHLSNEYLKKEEIYTIQDNKFKSLVTHSVSRVPYYRKILSGRVINSLNDIEKIPFLDKALIKSEFKNLKAEYINRKRFKSNSTSGSTGAAMPFFTDKKFNEVRHACAFRADSWTGWNFGKPVIYIWGAERDINKGLKGRIGNLVFRKEILSSFYMTNDDMDHYIQIINIKKPSLIIGYPSSLFIFSQYLESKNLQIHSPQGIITSGESLYQFQRIKIEKVFRTKVLNRYGCRDVGHIASECQLQNGLHISSDHVIVEIINEKGEKCEPGELGEIVITDLDNYVFPLIRYRIGDLGIMSEGDCPCGRPFNLLKSVEGRSFDLIIGMNGNRISASYFTTYFRYSVPSIEKFQIIQENVDQLDIYIEADESFTEFVKMKVITHIKEKLGGGMRVNFHKVDHIDLTSSGKHRWVISNISPFTN